MNTLKALALSSEYISCSDAVYKFGPDVVVVAISEYMAMCIYEWERSHSED